MTQCLSRVDEPVSATPCESADWPANAFGPLCVGQPFCGGVVAWGEHGLYFTLGKPKRWRRDADGTLVIPICWVGGGQEPNEDIAECAQREAEEELGFRVRLRSSEMTHWFDIREQQTYARQPCADQTAPLIAERRVGLDRPYKPGLPVGTYVYVGIYLAECSERAGASDVPGLLQIPRQASAAFRSGQRVVDASRIAVLESAVQLPNDAILRYDSGGPEEQIAALLEQGALPAWNERRGLR